MQSFNLSNGSHIELSTNRIALWEHGKLVWAYKIDFFHFLVWVQSVPFAEMEERINRLSDLIPREPESDGYDSDGYDV